MQRLILYDGLIFLMSITKKTFLACRSCPAMGWFEQRAQRNEDRTLAEQFRIDEGIEIGARARRLFPSGIFLEDRGTGAALVKTAALIADHRVDTLFEAAFQAGAFVARVDILQRMADGWHVIEVKSSLDPKDEYVDDLAYSVSVATASGLPVVRASLMVLSRDFRVGRSDAELFALCDQTDEVLSRAADMRNEFGRIATRVLSETQPTPVLTVACKGCDYFSECVGQGIETPVFEVPRLSGKKLEALLLQAILELREIPDDYPLSVHQARFVQVTKTCRPYFDAAGARGVLSRINWPAHYLDFETTKTCVPLYGDLAPHEQFVTQYSLHICDAIGNVTDHRENLAEHSRDGRRDLAEKLIEDLGSSGSIIVYSHFERTMLGRISALFPDLSRAVDAIRCRLFDLEPLFKDFLIHPKCKGRSSIKSVLPALTTMSYDGLEVAGGGDAMAAFAMLAKGRFREDEAVRLRSALLKYCHQDTLAMVRLHESVHRIAAGEWPMPQ